MVEIADQIAAPPACKAGALPAELSPQIGIKLMVGLSGLEPPTSRLSGVRSNQLSYRPINLNEQTFKTEYNMSRLPHLLKKMFRIYP